MSEISLYAQIKYCEDQLPQLGIGGKTVPMCNAVLESLRMFQALTVSAQRMNEHAERCDATIASLTKQLAEAHDQLQASQCAEKMSSDLLADARRNEARLTIAVEALTEIESHGRVDGTGMIAEDLARRALDEIGKLP